MEAYAGGRTHPGSFGILFQGDFFQLHEAFAGCKSIDENRNETAHVPERSLYLSYKLDKGYHHAVGDRPFVQPGGSPKKGHEVAPHESGTEERRGDGRKAGARLDLVT